jgi:hypothetical protein
MKKILNAGKVHQELELILRQYTTHSLKITDNKGNVCTGVREVRLLNTKEDIIVLDFERIDKDGMQ